MGDQYRKALEKLSANQRKKFLEEDWNSHFMLLELYSKQPSNSVDFDTFCKNFCQSLVSKRETDPAGVEPYSWEKYIEEQLKNSNIPVGVLGGESSKNLHSRDGSVAFDGVNSENTGENQNKQPIEY